MDDPRDNPPQGWKYFCMVTPWIERDSGCTCVWHDVLGRTVNVKGCLLIPRDIDNDGTCYCFIPNAEHQSRVLPSPECSCSAGFDPECKWEGHHHAD